MFALRVKRIHTRTKTLSRMSPSPLSRRLKRVRSACVTRSHEDLNAFASRVKCVRCVSHEHPNAFALRAKRVRSACETRLLYTLRLTGTVWPKLEGSGEVK